MTERDAFGNPTGSGQAPPIAPLGEAHAPAPPPLSPARASDLETQAWMSLGCSIGGWIFFPFVLPIIGIVLARRARTELPPSAARSATTAALWIAWTNIVLCLLAVAFMVTLLAAFWDTNDF